PEKDRSSSNKSRARRAEKGPYPSNALFVPTERVLPSIMRLPRWDAPPPPDGPGFGASVLSEAGPGSTRDLSLFPGLQTRFPPLCRGEDQSGCHALPRVRAKAALGRSIAFRGESLSPPPNRLSPSGAIRTSANKSAPRPR